VYGGLFVRWFAHHCSCFVCLEPSLTFSGLVQGDRLTPVLVRLPLAREFLNSRTVVIVFPSAKLPCTNKISTQFSTDFPTVCDFKILLSSISTFIPTNEERPLSAMGSKRTQSSQISVTLLLFMGRERPTYPSLIQMT
jgi:hypothetical protein